MVTFANHGAFGKHSRVNGTNLPKRNCAVLKANSAAKWVPVNTGTERRFKTSDGTAEATYASKWSACIDSARR